MNLGIGIGLPRWFRGLSGGGSAYHPAADAIFAAFTTPPDTARKGRINDYVLAGIAGGWWGKFDVKHEYMAADAQAALINWAQPGTYNGVAVNSPTFTADQGFKGNGSTNYIDTTFNPTTAPSPKFVQNSATLAGWALVAGTTSTAAMVGTSSPAVNELWPLYTGGLVIARINGTANPTAATPDGIGFVSASRSASNLMTGYRNGVSFGTDATASAAPGNENIKVLVGNAGFWNGLCSSLGILSQLSGAEHLSLYQAELAYQAGVATDKIVASFTTPPTAGRKTLIYQYVYDMMAAGAWWDGDADYWFAAADAQASLINLVNPGTYNAVAVNSPTFTADQGWTGGATKYIDSGFNPTTAPSPKFTQNDAHASGWSVGNVVVSAPIVGNLTGVLNYIAPRNVGDTYTSKLNSGGTIMNVANTDSTGFFAVTRSGATAQAAYKNGSSVASNASASAALTNTTIVFMFGNAVYWTGQVANGDIGASRDAAKQLAVYNAKLAYKLGLLGLTYTNPETGRIVDAFTTPPTQARVTLIDAYVTAMKAAGAWTDADADYWFAAADAQASLINLVNPGTYNAVAVNSPTFTADQGWTGASTKYISSGFNPTTAPSPKYTQDSAALTAWGNQSGQVTTSLAGNLSAGSLRIIPRYTDNNVYFRVNTALDGNAANLDGSGLFSANRSASNLTTLFKNGTSLGTGVGASAASTNAAILFLASFIDGYSTATIFTGGISASRDATKQLAVYNAKRAYATGVGIP